MDTSTKKKSKARLQKLLKKCISREKNMKQNNSVTKKTHQWSFNVIITTILASLTAIIYYPSLNYEFQFDDIANITKHFNIRHYSLERLFFSGPRWISYWLNSLNYKLGKFEPFYYRLFNISFHIINGLLVFFVIFYSLSQLKKTSFFTKNKFELATLTSLLFLLHPVQTQTVSYVIQGQLEGLSCMTILGMSLIFLLYARTQNTLSNVVLTCILFILAILSCGTKEIAIISPTLILLIDWFFVSQGDWLSLKKRLWLHIGIFATVFGIYLYLLKPQFFTDILGFKRLAKNNIGNVITHTPQTTITPWIFFISQFKVILHYLWMFIWPFGISVEYDWKLARDFLSPDAFIPFLALCLISWSVITLLRRSMNHTIAFGALWFFICIAPRSSIIPSPELLVDYKTYTASIGWLFILSCGIFNFFLWAKKQLKTKSLLLEQSYINLAFMLVFATLIGFATINRNQVWRSGHEFWENIIKNAPGKARAYNNYGVELSQKMHKFEESIPYFKKAIAMDANYPDPCNNLAVAYSQVGKIDLAIQALRRGIKINPYYPEGYNNLASFYVQKKKFDEAEKILKTALRLRPYYGKAYFNLGRVYLEKNEIEKAWECFKACCTKADLDNEFGFTMYGKASMRMKKYEDAIIAFTRLLEFKPNDYETYFSLANAYFLNKQHAKAIPLYKQLLHRNPDDVRITYNIAEAYLNMNNPDIALELFAKLKPFEKQFPHINIRMAACYEKMGRIPMAKELLAQLVQSNGPEQIKNNAMTLIAQLNKKYLT